MVGYCEVCLSNDNLIKQQNGEVSIYGGSFEQMTIKVICLNCGSTSLFTYDLSKIDLLEKGNKNLKEEKARNKARN